MSKQTILNIGCCVPCFSVYGRLSEAGNRQIVQINFTDVLPRKCSDNDYENWTVFEKVAKKYCRRVTVGCVFYLEFLARTGSAKSSISPNVKYKGR